MSTMRAHVHYGDWEGTAAADDADMLSLRSRLEKQGALDSNTEFLASIEFSIHENQAEEAYISVLIGEKPPGENWGLEFNEARNSLSLRRVPIEMSIAEFFGHFKRFAITLTARGLGLTDCEYEVKD